MRRFGSRFGGAQSLIVLLFVVACALGVSLQHASTPETQAPRARFDDTSTLGGKAFRLLLTQLGYTVKRADSRLASMPQEARAWVLLDPQTRFSRREATLLLGWVRAGGILVWACAPQNDAQLLEQNDQKVASTLLAQRLGVTPSSFFSPDFLPLPQLTPLSQNAPTIYRANVKNASASGDALQISRPALEIAADAQGTQLARIDIGKGHIFVMPDALMFTNYALAKPDNAVLATNLIRVHVPTGTIYFDERIQGDDATSTASTQELTWFDYLWHAPLRYALSQLFLAGLLWWAWAGRRLGAPVPIPVQEPVTRASQFAQGMGALFRKANRPQAVARVLGDEFRREVARRTGLTVDAEDSILAERAAQRSGLPATMIDRLLLRAKAPDDRESHILSDTQEMEIVLRALRGENVKSK